MWVAGTHVLGPSSASLPGCIIRDLGEKRNRQNWNPQSDMGCRHHKQWLSLLHHNTGPRSMLSHQSFRRTCHFLPSQAGLQNITIGIDQGVLLP